MYLIPGTSHIITWQKQNLLDTATYYVRAVVRDVRSNTVLDTIDLSDLGSSQRFSGIWNVIPDPSNQGREISIVKTVYEDSSYSTVSGVYGAWEDRYLIYDPVGALRSNSGGWNAGSQNSQSTIDYGLIAGMIARAVSEAIAKLPPPQPVDFSEVIGEIGGVKQTLGERLKALVTFGKRADTIESAVSDVKQAAEAVRQDTIEVRQLANGIKQTLAQHLEDLQEFHTESLDASKSDQKELLSKVSDAVEEAIDKYAPEESEEPTGEKEKAPPTQVVRIEFAQASPSPRGGTSSPRSEAPTTEEPTDSQMMPGERPDRDRKIKLIGLMARAKHA